MAIPSPPHHTGCEFGRAPLTKGSHNRDRRARKMSVRSGLLRHSLAMTCEKIGVFGLRLLAVFVFSLKEKCHIMTDNVSL